MPTLPWEIAAKAALYAAVLAAIGTCAIQSLLLPLLTELPSDEIDAIVRALAPLRTRAAAALLITLGLRALTQTAAVFGWPAVLSWDEVQEVVIASRWGAAWHLQVVAALLFLVACLWAGRRPGSQARSHCAACACVAACYSMPLLGHGASSWWRVLLHGTHILGAGVWAGTLVALALMRMPSALRLTLLRGVTPLALSGAAIVGLAGVVMAWSYLGPLSNLWANLRATTYGQVLALKLAIVGGVAGSGFFNWGRFAAERRGAARTEQLWPVAIEVVLVAVVVVVTAALTELAHP